MIRRSLSSIFWINYVTNWFIFLAEKYSYSSLMLGMAMESLGIPFAGLAAEMSAIILVSEGKMNFTLAVIAAAVGNTIGSAASYGIGYKFGNIIRKRRKDHKLAKREESLQEYIRSYGTVTIFFTQLLGFTRPFISFPAGLLKFDFKKFILATLGGGIIYSTYSLYLTVIIRNIYDKFVFPYIGLSFASLAILIGAGYIITHFSIHFGKKFVEYQNGKNNGNRAAN